MKKRIIAIFVLIAFLISAAGIVSADNNTTNTTEEIIDLSQYITADQSVNNEVMFSNGYTGFIIDSSKGEVTPMDGFVESQANNLNDFKSAVIEAYKQQKSGELGSIMKSFADGSYKSSSDSVIQSALSSGESYSDHESVEINDTTQATFDFEVLKPVNESTSDYFAYKVSFKTVAKEDNDTSDSTDDDLKSDSSESSNKTEVKAVNNDTKTKTADNNTKTAEKTKTADNNTKTAEKTKTADNNTKTAEKNESKTNEKNKTSDNKTPEKANDTETHVTNKTIINKTNTIVVNQKNTTIINEHNVKTINKTNNETPENSTVDSLLKTAGNPIFILAVVIIILAIVGIVYYRKD